MNGLATSARDMVGLDKSRTSFFIASFLLTWNLEKNHFLSLSHFWGCSTWESGVWIPTWVWNFQISYFNRFCNNSFFFFFCQEINWSFTKMYNGTYTSVLDVNQSATIKHACILNANKIAILKIQIQKTETYKIHI